MRTLGTKDSDLAFTVVDGLESLQQRAVQRLLLIRGEWFLAAESGVPYYADVLGRIDDAGIVEQAITNRLKAVEGVLTVKNARLILEPATRTATYRADATAEEGTFTIQIGVG